MIVIINLGDLLCFIQSRKLTGTSVIFNLGDSSWYNKSRILTCVIFNLGGLLCYNQSRRLIVL